MIARLHGFLTAHVHVLEQAQNNQITFWIAWLENYDKELSGHGDAHIEQAARGFCARIMQDANSLYQKVAKRSR